MKLTNSQIYTSATNLNSAFTDSKQYLPIKLNFAIQKNAQTLSTLAEEIEKERMNIFKHYGKTDTEKGIVIPEENRAEASKELNDLFNIEQDVNILTININSFGDNLSLSLEQMNAIMFMIEEEN